MSGQSAKQQHAMPNVATRPLVKRFSWMVSTLSPFVFGVVLTVGVGLLVIQEGVSCSLVSKASPSTAPKIKTLEWLLSLSPEQLAGIDIAEMHLLCATGLPGSEDLNIDKCLAKLDQWAARVKYETERHLYRLTDPRYKEYAEYHKSSEARFRAEWLVAVLQQDIGLHYHDGFVPQAEVVPPFKTSKQTFLHGLMDQDDAHKAFGGNCVSLPVAYAAVGRRLGYPVKLVTANEHVFCRWEGLDSPNPTWRERFNFDGTGTGFSIDSDEFYLTWPRPSAPDQAELHGWLKSLTPQEELSVFLNSRGAVLMQVNRDPVGALMAFVHAIRLRPDSVQPMYLAKRATEGLYENIVAAHPDAYQQMVARLATQEEGSSRPGDGNQFGISPSSFRTGGTDKEESNVPWWKTEEGRAENLAEIQRIHEINQPNHERMMQWHLQMAPSSQTVQPYRPPIHGVTKPYQPPMPDLPRK